MRFIPMIIGPVIAGLLLQAISGMPASAQDAASTGDIVARIGDDAVVTRREFERSLNTMRRGATDAAVPHDQQIELLNNIVDVKLQYLLAMKSGVKVSDAEVDEDIKQKTRSMTPEQLSVQLERAGITNDEFRLLTREQIAVARFRQTHSDKVEAVTDDDIAAEFEELNKNGQFDRVDVSHILIMVPEGSDEAGWLEAKKRIDAAHTRVTTGKEDFKAVIAEVSEDPGGGIYPNTPRGKMVPEFEERMFTLPVGGISEPFRTSFGWHVLTPTGKTTKPLGEVSQRLRVFITERRINDIVMEQVAKAKASMEIEIRLDAPTDKPAS